MAKPWGKFRQQWQGLGRWWRRSAANLLFPPQCGLCDADLPSQAGNVLLCPPCLKKLQPPAKPPCPKCGMPLYGPLAEDGHCPECRGHDLLFAAAKTLGVYQAHLREAVLRAKHTAHEPLAATLGQFLGQTLASQPFPGEIDLVVPIPMHWWKRFRRGTNPAETIATACAAELSLPYESDLLVCRRLLAKQGTLPPDERRKNVRDAFALSSAFDVRDSSLLLVDDVITTGATASDASRALLAAGAKQVCIAAIARGTGAGKG